MKHKAKSSAECMGREEVVRSSAKGKVLANHLEWESTYLGTIQGLPGTAKWPLCFVVMKVRGNLQAKVCDFSPPIFSCSGVGTVKLLDLTKLRIFARQVTLSPKEAKSV